MLTRSRPCNYDFLVTLLARSGRVPFEFLWSPGDSSYIADELLDVLVQNMDRMGALCLLHRIPNGTTARLLQHKAPWLRKLVSREKNVVVLPADLGPQWLPRLEDLRIENFVIPADFQPLSAVTSFDGCLAKRSSTPVLSRIFPRVIELNLGGLTPEALLILGPPSSSCRRVWLKSSHIHRGRKDHSVFLQSCSHLRIPFLGISGATSLLPSIQEFVHTTVAQYRMFVCHDNFMLKLECDDDEIIRELWITDVFQVLLREIECFARLDRLSELVLPLGLLLDIHRQQSHAITPFLALRSLTIILPFDTVPSLASRQARDGRLLQMPRLDAVTLEAWACDYNTDDDTDEATASNVHWITVEFPRALPALLDAGRPRLTTVTVVLIDESEAAHFAITQDLSALRGLGETLRVRDQESDYVKDFVDG